MTKQIGILISRNIDGSISIPKAYAEFINGLNANIRPIFVYDDNVYTDLDLLILPGGADVDPLRYNQKPYYYTQNPNIQYEYWDKFVLSKYIENRIPIFGICRGFQTLNVHYGGSLSQHINQAYSSKSRDEEVDFLSIINNNTVKDLLNKIGFKEINKTYKVNSLHHQGFFYEQKGKNILPLLINTRYENIEAFISLTDLVAGVQWHPEELDNCTFSKLIINHLINSK